MLPRTRRAVRLAGLRIASQFIRTPPPRDRAPRRILLIRPDHLGDLLFTGPALRWLRAAYPDAHISMLAGPWGRELADRLPGMDEVLTLPFPWFDRTPKGDALRPYRLLAGEAERLRARDFDTAIVLRFDHWWGALLAAQAGIPRRIGYGIPECRPFLTDAVPYQPGLHEAVQNVRLLHLGFGHPFTPPDPQRDRLSLLLDTADRAAAARLLPSDGRPVAALHVGAGAPVKVWPAASFAALGNLLAEQHGLRIVLTGANAELPLVEAVEAGLREAPARVVGRPLALLAAALERCALVIGADSGVLHLATAVGTPTVHLYGPVDAGAFGPWGPPVCAPRLLSVCQRGPLKSSR